MPPTPLATLAHPGGGRAGRWGCERADERPLVGAQATAVLRNRPESLRSGPRVVRRSAREVPSRLLVRRIIARVGENGSVSRSSTPATPRVAHALDRLRETGERITPARQAVLSVLDEADSAEEHLTAEQIGARVAELEPAVHRATVYRTLTALTAAGVLTHVHIGGSATVYHLVADADEAEREPTGEIDWGTAAYGHGHQHAHVQCAACGRVFDIPPGALDSVARQLRDELGFLLDTSHAALLGTCADCS